MNRVFLRINIDPLSAEMVYGIEMISILIDNGDRNLYISTNGEVSSLLDTSHLSSSFSVPKDKLEEMFVEV